MRRLTFVPIMFYSWEQRRPTMFERAIDREMALVLLVGWLVAAAVTFA